MDAVLIYPLRFEPVLKDYIWGGRNLARLFDRELPLGTVAESWEIAAHDDGSAKVINGHFAGQTLAYVHRTLGLDLIGSNNQWAQDRGKFPLLIKLLDANESLSVQVHPDDTYALRNEGNELGKTEMWVVLHVEPQAALILGTNRQVDRKMLREAIIDGKLEAYLHQLAVKAGDVVCVPAGTLHAILKGSVIAEIQQNSNTTYRVYDWNRVDSRGQSRPLHIEQALDVVDYSKVKPGLAQPSQIANKDGIRRELLCSNPYFTTERVFLEAGKIFCGSCDGKTFEIWGVIEGSASIAGESVPAVGFVLLPAALGQYEVLPQSGSCVLLRVYTPLSN